MSGVWGAHSIAVLQVLRKVVLQVGRLLVHVLHNAGVELLMWRLWKLRVKLLPLSTTLLRLLPLLLLQSC